MSAFASELAYIKVVFYLLYSTDILYTALIKEMVGVNTMSKSSEAMNSLRSLTSAWQGFMSCRCSVESLPQNELWDFYLFPPTHRGGSSFHKKVLHCPGESLAIKPLPGRSELTWDGREQPGKSWGESELQGSMAMDKPGKYRVGQLFTWCLVSGTNQAQLLKNKGLANPMLLSSYVGLSISARFLLCIFFNLQ